MGKLGCDDGKKTALLAAVILAQKIKPLIRPIAYVMLRAKSAVTSKSPAMKAARRIITSTAGQ